jgi:HAMP domain-containing protein
MANGRAALSEEPPSSRLARRRPAEPSIEKRRDESAPPTKPSIVPPSPRPPNAKNTDRSPAHGSPFTELEQAVPPLTYGSVLVLGGVALGLGALLAAASGIRTGTTWLSGGLGFLAVGILIFSLSMALVISLSFARRLNALAAAAERVAHLKSAPAAPEPRADAIGSLARSLANMSERIAKLSAELELQSEREQGRLDELVRQRTRDLTEENEDLKRALGESKGLLSVDGQGRIVGHCSAIISQWLGPVPRGSSCWAYFDQAARGAGQRFEESFAELTAGGPKQLALQRLPRNLAVGERYLALEYRAIQTARGDLQRLLLILSDISIPEPDPATPS